MAERSSLDLRALKTITFLTYPVGNAFLTFLLLGMWASTSMSSVAALVALSLLAAIQLLTARLCWANGLTTIELKFLGLLLTALAFSWNVFVGWCFTCEKPLI